MPELDDLPIGGSRQFHLAALSIDIRGFTDIALKLNNAELQKLARLQALYLSEMSAVIRDYNGVTEKYTGDGVMGLFGTESDTTAASDVKNAISCAMTVKVVLQNSLNPFLQEKALPEIRCGMGADYGPVLMERVGLRGENQFSLVGPTISLAAKLQGAAEVGQILIGSDVYNRMSDQWKSYCSPAPKNWTYTYPAFDYRGMWTD
jgi:adenylate cyclase